MMISVCHCTPQSIGVLYSRAVSFPSLLRLGKRRKCFIQSYRFCSSHSTQVNADLLQKDFSGKLPPLYESTKVESGWYKWWEQEGLFQLPQGSCASNDKQIFTMILPPPNVTGTLHLGHALTVTVQDVIARWKRMCGHPVLWVPGTDHAGIATQVVVEKQLWAQKKVTRRDLGREKFIAEVQNWQEYNSIHIKKQLRLMGATLDWTREYFTMDEKRSLAVVEAFIHLFEEGLIYRSNAPVNWSCWLQSAISDIEIESLEIEGPTALQVPGYVEPVVFGTLWNIVYKQSDDDPGIVVSTTRPETMLGDVAIAVHPSDHRYTHLHGSHFWHPYRKEKIPLICDDFVDQDFGTGAVKITPAHDKVDFQVAKQHDLPLISVINEEGSIKDNFCEFKGMKRFEARKLIIKDLASRGLLQGEFPHKMIVPLCTRSGDVVESIPKPQWFLSTGIMANKAIRAVKDGHLRLNPQQSEQFWNNWFEDNQDWCLSRQLWWGHRVPVYKCFVSDMGDCKWIAARNEQEAKLKASIHFSCQSDDLNLVALQDEDVLDTWFSSSILPLSALGWPLERDDLKRLYPLSLMVTGNDILLFWVARMVILGQTLTNQSPFSNAFLHGVIQDASGKKMSKSLGNVISPEDIREGRTVKELTDQVISNNKSGLIQSNKMMNVMSNLEKMFPKGIPQCGTDALRLCLCSYEIEKRFINFDISDCDSARKFCNKLWQACRYVEGVFGQSDNPRPLQPGEQQLLDVMDLWILSKLCNLILKLDKDLRNLNFSECVNGLQNFIHHEFCDVYLESTKVSKYSYITESKHLKDSTKKVLVTCIQTVLILLHPFMPFITEELYQRIPYILNRCKSIMLHPYPLPADWLCWKNTSLEREIDFILQTASSIRKLKTNNGLKVINRVSVKLSTESEEEFQYFTKHKIILEAMSFSDVVDFSQSFDVVSTDIMTEEKVNRNCLVTIILNDEDKLASQNHRYHLVKLAMKKHMKLQQQIMKTKARIASPTFSLKDQRFKQAFVDKMTDLEEENKKTEIFLASSPDLREKIQKEMARECELEKTAKV